MTQNSLFPLPLKSPVFKIERERCLLYPHLSDKEANPSLSKKSQSDAVNSVSGSSSTFDVERKKDEKGSFSEMIVVVIVALYVKGFSLCDGDDG